MLMQIVYGILGLIVVLGAGHLVARLVLSKSAADPAHQRLAYPIIVVGVAMLLCVALFLMVMSVAD